MRLQNICCSLSFSPPFNVVQHRRENDSAIETTKSRGSQECMNFPSCFGALCGQKIDAHEIRSVSARVYRTRR